MKQIFAAVGSDRDQAVAAAVFADNSVN